MEAERLAIVSFNIRKGRQYLHHNLVAALLNDLFGIQVRASRMHTSAYVSIRQHTSAYVSIRMPALRNDLFGIQVRA